MFWYSLLVFSLPFTISPAGTVSRRLVFLSLEQCILYSRRPDRYSSCIPLRLPARRSLDWAHGCADVLFYTLGVDRDRES